jgi:hypothetical protein
MTFQVGFRNILLGFLHTVFDKHYEIKIGCLLFTEVVFLFFVLIVLNKGAFFSHLKVWVNILATLLRILLILTFYFDVKNI